MSFQFLRDKWNFKCSPFKFFILAIVIQFLILFGALYLFQYANFNQSIVIIYVRIFTISISFTSLSWLIKNAMNLRYGKIVRENKHICMSISIVICLIFLLYAFIVAFAIDDNPINGYFLMLNSFTFFIISLTLIVDIIRPDKNNQKDGEADRPSISVSDIYQNSNVQTLSYIRNNGREKNRRVSFAANENNGNIGSHGRAESFHLIKWANQLENLSHPDQFKIQKIVREMRLRARTFNSGRQSEQLFTGFSAEHFYKKGVKVIEEDPSS